MDGFITLVILGLVIFVVAKIGEAFRGPSSNYSGEGVRVTARSERGLSQLKGNVSVHETSDGIVLNKNGRAPVTISGVTKQDVQPIAEGVRSYEHPLKLKERLGLIIAQKNAESPEVEHFLNEVHERYDRVLKDELSREPGYEDWPKADKEDFEAEAREAAAEQVPLCSPFEDISVLMNERPEDVTSDDAITRKFEDDIEALRLYLRLCGRKKPLEAADREERQILERLVDSDLAIRGKDLPVEVLLEQLRMKDIQRILGDKAPKKFTRKANAIEFAAKTENIEDLVAEEIPLRSTYQASKPPGDIHAAAQAFRFATEYAGLIVTTLITESQAQRNYEGGKQFEVDGEDCMYCKRFSDKEFTKRAKQSFPPHHVGCACYLSITEFD